MAFSKEEINKLENPYDQFRTGDSLAENVAVLDALSAAEKISLATKIIAACPESMFKQYGHQINALKHPTKDEGSFHSVITEAYQVRRRIFALLDPRNGNPHAVLLGEEFNPAPFHRFNDLAKQLLKSNEVAIAERLALCAPEETRSQVASNLNIAFPRSALVSQTHLAFTLRRDINRLLLGDNPEQFFTSRDFDNDTCKKFPNLLHTLLKDHVEAIGTKLSTIASAETRAEIKRHLALLHTELFDDTNPFKLITDAMVAKEGAMQKKSTAQASTTPAGFFRAASPVPLKRQPVIDASCADDAGEESESEAEVLPSFR